MVERVRINYCATGVLDLSDASARSTRDLSTSGHAHPLTASVACHCSVIIDIWVKPIEKPPFKNEL